MCLDLANTIDNRPAPDRRRDYLRSPPDLIDWALQAGAVSPADAKALRQATVGDPSTAARAFTRAIRLREAIYRTFSAIAAGRRPPPADLTLISRLAAEALAHQQLHHAATGCAWSWSADARGRFDRIGWAAAQSAAELLVSKRQAAIRECEADTCGWLFLDNSRNQSRRWCDMRVCGNRVKARRFYARRESA